MTYTARLIELATQATPGPWVAASNFSVHRTGDMYASGGYTEVLDGFCIEAPKYDDHVTHRAAIPEEADAAYIAAANPTAILSLLDELDASKARIAEGWQDIATAPKEEGAEVLLWDGLYRYLANRNGGEWWVLMEFTVTSATHWRPLPPPPHGDAK
jgi:hypothetical protein